MGVKKDIIDTPLKITEIFRVGPRVKAPRDKRDWDFLIYELKKLKVTPGEAYRIIAEKKGNNRNTNNEGKTTKRVL